MEIVGSSAARFMTFVPCILSTPVPQQSSGASGNNLIAHPFQVATSKRSVHRPTRCGAFYFSNYHQSFTSVVPSHASRDSGACIRTHASFPGRSTFKLHGFPVRNDATIITHQNVLTLACGRTGVNLSSRVILPRSASCILKRRIHRNNMGAANSRLGRAVPKLQGNELHAARSSTKLRASKSVEILVNPNSINKELLSKISILKKPYKRPFYLSNCHVETIFAAYFRTLPKLTYHRECLKMLDGGTVALDWPIAGEDEELWRGQLDQEAPVLVLLPGLTGGSGDTYVRHLLIKARKAGWRVVVFNSRGCGDSPVTSAQFYSASFTEDLRQVVLHVGSLYQKSRVYAAGWSLGANILVRYIGQEGENCPLAGAVSLCNPFDLVLADINFHKGFNNIYDRSLAGALGKIFAKHASLFENIGGDFNIPLAANARTVRDFDDGITRVSFGFKSVDEYYFQSSSAHSIKDVRIPLLCIQAEDDPIAPSAGIPRADIEANLNCALVVTPAGGHLGWVTVPEAPFGSPWTDPLVSGYLSLLDTSLQRESAFASSRKQSGDAQLIGTETRETSGEEISITEPIIR